MFYLVFEDFLFIYYIYNINHDKSKGDVKLLNKRFQPRFIQLNSYDSSKRKDTLTMIKLI